MNNLKPIRFITYGANYFCSEPGDMSGEYYRVEDVREAMAGLVAKAQAASDCYCTPLEDSAMSELRTALAALPSPPQA